MATKSAAGAIAPALIHRRLLTVPTLKPSPNHHHLLKSLKVKS
ncbi:MAG: hypothetical protein AAFU71_15335 [Cyanobacteria bacterium J06632_22]